MKTKALLFVAGFLLVTGFAYPVERVKVPKTEKVKVSNVFSPIGLGRIDAYMKKAVNDESIPSAVCYVEYKGKAVYYKAFGDANREMGKSLAKNAIFRNASQTKLVTTVALMTLYEEGRFNLDDPIKQYLPEFSHPVVRVSGTYEGGDLVTRPAKGDITIRQLLSHSAGISYDSYDQDVRIICYSDSDSTINTAEVVRRIAQLPLRHDPGKGFTYGFNVEVAGRLAEVLTGKRLDEVIQERVLKPLDMKDTYFYLPQNKAKRLVPLYQKPTKDDAVVLAGDSLERFYPLSAERRYFGGGAGLSGTIVDYAHLCRMILNWGNYNKKRILSRKTIEQMCSDQLFGNAGNYMFGLGLEITTEETAIRSMKSIGSLRWGGLFGTEYLIDPKEELIILFYTNRVSWYSNTVYDDFVRLVYMSLY